MKLILIPVVAVIFLASQTSAQIPRDYKTSKYSYQEIVQVESATKRELYMRAKLWLITNLASQESDLTYHNEEAGTVIANGHFNTDYKHIGLFEHIFKCNINFAIKISTKQDKYRYELTNFTYEITAWNLTDSNGNIKPVNHVRTPLERGPCYIDFFIECWSKANRKALERFLGDIHQAVKSKIASLSDAMEVDVLEDDEW